MGQLAGRSLTCRIGNGVASALLDAGAKVVIVSSSAARVKEAVSALGSPNVTGEEGDVRDEAKFTSLLQSLAPVDHIVFSAVDKIIRGKLEDLDLDDAKYLFGVKFWGSVVTAKGECGMSHALTVAVLKYNIIRRGGSLTLTSGMAAIHPGKGASVGGALNNGLLAMTKGLAAELADKKIRVNCVIPGLVQTGLHGKIGRNEQQQKEMYESAAKSLAVGFVGTPEHIAEAYMYAIRADYATGTLIQIGKRSILDTR